MRGFTMLYEDITDYKKVLDNFNAELNPKLKKMFSKAYEKALEIFQKENKSLDEGIRLKNCIHDMDHCIYFIATVYDAHTLSEHELYYFSERILKQGIYNIIDYFDWFGLKNQYYHRVILLAVKAGANSYITQSSFWNPDVLRKKLSNRLTLAQYIIVYAVAYDNIHIVKDLGNFIEGYWESDSNKLVLQSDNRGDLLTKVFNSRAINFIQDKELFPLSFWDKTGIKGSKTVRHFAIQYVLVKASKELDASKEWVSALLNMFQKHESTSDTFKLHEFIQSLSTYLDDKLYQNFFEVYSALIFDRLEKANDNTLENTVFRVKKYLDSSNRDVTKEQLLWIEIALANWNTETLILGEEVHYNQVIRIGKESAYYNKEELKRLINETKEFLSPYRTLIFTDNIFSGLNDLDLKQLIDTTLRIYDKQEQINKRLMSNKASSFTFFSKESESQTDDSYNIEQNGSNTVCL
jgi:hypothetical protein